MPASVKVCEPLPPLVEDAGVEAAVVGGRGVVGRALVGPGDGVAHVHGDDAGANLKSLIVTAVEAAAIAMVFFFGLSTGASSR